MLKIWHKNPKKRTLQEEKKVKTILNEMVENVLKWNFKFV